MLWNKIILDGYLPFSHVGNKHVEIEFDKPATCIIGANGSGKSSLLRVMDVVTPPTRPDFAKDGKLVMELTHDGHIFTLTSDFKNSTAPHSFKKDGIELNLSGTSDTQKDLAFEHLGVSQIINDLMAGNIHLCTMPKSQRKQLFSSTYPSDLSFILEYHKKVCSQIRAYTNQIKLLQNREGSLVVSLMEKAELDRLEEFRSAANDTVVRIDKINLLLENEINQLKNHDVLKNDYDLSVMDTAISSLEAYRKCILSKLVDYGEGQLYGENLSVDELSSKELKLRQEEKYLREKADIIKSNLQATRDELDKFVRIKNMPTSDKKDELSAELELTLKEMESLKNDPNWKNVPDVQQDKLDMVRESVDRINNYISVLHPYAGILIGQETLNNLKSESDSLRFSLSSLNNEKVSLEYQLQQHKSRKSMMTQNSYPGDCARVCGLRATLEASVRDIDLRCKEIETRLAQINRDIVDCQDKLNSCQKRVQDVTPAIPTMKLLWDTLSSNYIIDLALNGEGFVECLNDHGFEIVNRVTRGLESSRIYYRYKELFDKATAMKTTLTAMESSNAVSMSLDMLNEIISDKENVLNKGIVELDALEQQAEQIKLTSTKLSDMRSDLESLDNIIADTNKAANASLILNRIKFDEQLIAEHNVVRETLSVKLREVEHTLQEQKRIIDVLDTEIRPTLQQLRDQKRDWETVESGLSPTKGLPCIYLIRFMNRVFARANSIIANIWYCDMELAYIEEKDDLDFSISLILNKNTTVKDISLCSNGQKAIVDFAITLAIAIERGFNKWLPFKCDEIDAALTPEHRAKLTQCISDYIDDGTIKQLMLVNHFSVQTGIMSSDVVSLSEDGLVLPSVYNEHVVIN